MDNSTNQINKGNYIFFLMDGAFFFLALSFISQDGLIPIFIDTFAGNVTLIGAATTIKMLFSALPKILLGNKLNHIQNKPRFTAVLMLMTRPLILFMIPVLIIIENSRMIVYIFLFIYMLMWSGQSVVALLWTDIFGRTVEGKYRGKIQGYQQLLGGMGGIGAGIIVKLLLDNDYLRTDVAYMIIFGLSGLFMIMSGIMILFVKDRPGNTIKSTQKFSEYLKKLPIYLKHKRFRKVSVTMLIAKVVLLGNPFMILVAKNEIDVSNKYITTLIYIQIIGTLIGGLLWGNVSHRFGNLKVIVLSNVLILISALSVCGAIILNDNLISVFLITFSVLLGGVNMSCWLGYMNYILDIAEDHERMDMLVVQSILILPISFVGYFLGVAVAHWGYLLMFVGILFLTIIALRASLRIEEA